jgi:hypothetical protein
MGGFWWPRTRLRVVGFNPEKVRPWCSFRDGWYCHLWTTSRVYVKFYENHRRLVQMTFVIEAQEAGIGVTKVVVRMEWFAKFDKAPYATNPFSLVAAILHLPSRSHHLDG